MILRLSLRFASLFLRRDATLLALTKFSNGLASPRFQSASQFIEHLGSNDYHQNYPIEILASAASLSSNLQSSKEFLESPQMNKMLLNFQVEGYSTQQLLFSFFTLAKILHMSKGSQGKGLQTLKTRAYKLRDVLDKLCFEDKINPPQLFDYCFSLSLINQNPSTALNSAIKLFKVQQFKRHYDSKAVWLLAKTIENSPQHQKVFHFDFMYSLIRRLTVEQVFRQFQQSSIISFFQDLACLELHKRTTHRKYPELLKQLNHRLASKAKSFEKYEDFLAVFRAYQKLSLSFDFELFEETSLALQKFLKSKKVFPIEFFIELFVQLPPKRCPNIKEIRAIIISQFFFNLDLNKQNLDLISRALQNVYSFYQTQTKQLFEDIFYKVNTILKTPNGQINAEWSDAAALIISIYSSLIPQKGLVLLKESEKSLNSLTLNGKITLIYCSQLTGFRLNPQVITQVLAQIQSVKDAQRMHSVVMQYVSRYFNNYQRYPQMEEISETMLKRLQAFVNKYTIQQLIKIVVHTTTISRNWYSFMLKALSKFPANIFISQFAKLPRKRRSKDLARFACKLLSLKQSLFASDIFQFLMQLTKNNITSEFSQQTMQQFKELYNKLKVIDSQKYMNSCTFTDIIYCAHLLHNQNLQYRWLIILACQKPLQSDEDHLQLLDLFCNCNQYMQELINEHIQRVLLCYNFVQGHIQSSPILASKIKFIRCGSKLLQLGIKIDKVFFENILIETFSQHKGKQQLLLQTFILKKSKILQLPSVDTQALQKSIFQIFKRSNVQAKSITVDRFIDRLQFIDLKFKEVIVQCLIISLKQQTKEIRYFHYLDSIMRFYFDLPTTQNDKNELIVVFASNVKKGSFRVSQISFILRKIIIKHHVYNPVLLEAISYNLKLNMYHYMRFAPEIILVLSKHPKPELMAPIVQEFLILFQKGLKKQSRVRDAYRQAIKKERFLKQGLQRLGIKNSLFSKSKIQAQEDL